MQTLDQPHLQQRYELHMGTAVILSVPQGSADEAEVNAVMDRCFARMAEIDARFSPYKPESEITRYGRGELEKSELSSDVLMILDFCEKLHDATDGAFDIYEAARGSVAWEHQLGESGKTRPIEPSGAVKGWAIEQCADEFRNAGIRHFCVNIGGDIYAGGYERPQELHGDSGIGSHSLGAELFSEPEEIDASGVLQVKEALWSVGIQHPLSREHVMEVLYVTDAAVATSGLYERGEHIAMKRIDAGDTDALLSVTIVGPDIALADAYATAVFAMGRAGLDWIVEQTGFDVLAVTSEHEVLTSPGIAKYRLS